MHCAIELLCGESHNCMLDVSEDWRRWCRLCAKEDVQNINIFHITEDVFTTTNNKGYDQAELLTAIDRYFNVEIKPDEKFPIKLCSECFVLLTSLISFKERVIKVQQMYLALQKHGYSTVEGLETLRQKYNVMKDDRPHDFMYRSLSEINFFEHKLEIDDYEEEVDINTMHRPEFGDDIKEEIANYSTTQMDEEDISDSDSDVGHNNNEDEMSDNALHDIESNSLCRTLIKKVDSKKSDKTKLTEDIDVENKKRPYTCQKCSMNFKVFGYYRSHMKRIHARTDVAPFFVCSVCNLSFGTSRQLKHHKITKHTPIIERRVIPCTFCDQKFSSITAKTQHIRFVHRHERPVICEECGEGTRTKAELKKHMLVHTDYTPFECEICKKCFKTLERLKKHTEIHSPNKHTCPECGLQLNSRSTMNNHLLVHSDVKRHKCDYCGKAFKRSKELKNHLILHTGIKPYSCEFCGKTYSNASTIRGHKKKQHPEELAAMDAAGEKSYSKNIPKLATLKAVVRKANYLKRIVNKKAGEKRKFVLDSVDPININQLEN